MYPIDFSQGRKKKKQTQFKLVMPKLSMPFAIAAASMCVLVLVVVFALDYSSMSRANSTIIEMIAVAKSEDGKVRTKMRKLAGIKPITKTKGSELHETYTFDRTISVFASPAVTVVYSSSGKVLDILRSAE